MHLEKRHRQSSAPPKRRNVGLSNSQARLLAAIPWDAPVDVIEAAKQLGLRSGLNPAFALQDRGLVARVGIRQFIRVRSSRPADFTLSVIAGGIEGEARD